jgi:hypothetical protein
MRTLAGLLLTTLLTMSAGCAKTDWIDRTLVTVDVTGTWSGRSAGGAALVDRAFVLELKQEGSRVTGSMRTSPVGLATSGPINGTVAGDVFSFRLENGNVEGELAVSGDEMNGRVSYEMQTRRLSLQRVDSSSRPASPPR